MQTDGQVYMGLEMDIPEEDRKRLEEEFAKLVDGKMIEARDFRAEADAKLYPLRTFTQGY